MIRPEEYSYKEEITHKVCDSCYNIMPLELFYRSVNGKYGRRNKCKYCLFDERRNKVIPIDLSKEGNEGEVTESS